MLKIDEVSKFLGIIFFLCTQSYLKCNPSPPLGMQVYPPPLPKKKQKSSYFILVICSNSNFLVIANLALAFMWIMWKAKQIMIARLRGKRMKIQAGENVTLPHLVLYLSKHRGVKTLCKNRFQGFKKCSNRWLSFKIKFKIDFLLPGRQHVSVWNYAWSWDSVIETLEKVEKYVQV